MDDTRRAPSAALERLRNLSALYRLEREAPDGDAGSLRPHVLQQMERVRHEYRSRVGRLSAAETIEGLAFELLEDVLREASAAAVADASSIATCFRVVEGLRARALLDRLGGISVRPFPTPALAEAAAARERDVLRFAIANREASDALNDYELGSRLPIGQPALLPEVEALFARADAGMIGGATVATLAEVQAALRPDEVLLEYCVPAHAVRPPHELWVLVITQDDARLLPPVALSAPDTTTARIAVDGQAPIDFFALNDAVVQLRRGVQDDDTRSPARLSRMYDVLVGPVARAGVDLGRHRHWIIVPDGALHDVPFAALLRPDGRHLGAEVALSIVPSASAWLALRGDPPPLRSFVGFANPTVGGLPDLPEAQRELEQACRLLRNRGVGCEAYVGAAATAAGLQRRAAGHSVLHVAAHGERATAHALDLQALLLAPGDGDDGRVEAREFRALDLRATALAVLSVCDSGTYRRGAGNELHGLVAALLTAGARDVVATLWPIDDAMGCRFMLRFYTHLVACGPAEALRHARADLIAQGAAVRDWAAFVVVGPGRAAPAAGV